MIKRIFFFRNHFTGLFDQETLDLMNKKRCGLPDKDTKFTRLVSNTFSNLAGGFGLTRRKRFEVFDAKYDQRNLTWSVIEFSKKALKNQDDKVLEVMNKAFKIWTDETNLNFQYKEKSNKSDILIGFYSKAHGNQFEPPFDGQNGKNQTNQTLRKFYLSKFSS